MKAYWRHITSLLLTMIYLLFVLGPLAPLAMKSKVVAHALTGECSGDCSIDGCSHERSAAHTCCCWQKKRRELITQQTNQDEYAVKTAASPAKIAGCCAAASQHTHEAAEPASEPDRASKKKRTAIGTTPCGSGKLFTLSNGEDGCHLPFSFCNETPSPELTAHSCTTPGSLISRLGDPPDPPPIITFRA